MKVLVTGGCGFLGSHVCEYYIGKNVDVVAYDNMTKHELARTGFATEVARKFNREQLENMGVRIVQKDVRDFDNLLKEAEGCDYIIHTAAQPAMTISWEDPRLDFTSNALGTFNVLETARMLKIPVACCATVHVYGNEINNTLTESDTRYVREPVGIDELEPMLRGTLTPLHASKATGDIYINAYIDTYQLEAASFRLTGIYGTRQFGGEDHGWVANFVIRAVMGWPITLFGTGKQVRDIIYATDVCNAFDAFYNTRASGIYNIGGGRDTAISLIECVDLIEELTGTRPDVTYAPDRHGDLRYFVCDTTKAKRQLSWSPSVIPHEGVARLIDWVQKNKHCFGSC